MIVVTWYEQYIGRPWAAAPNPPESFNCGELLRYIHLKELNIETPSIEIDASSLKACVARMRPALFGLRPLAQGQRPSEYDCAFFARARYEDHCGIAVATVDGLLIMHCLQGVGVVLESEAESKKRGFHSITWCRHTARG